MEKIKTIVQKIIFGSVFCIILPLLLVFWAKSTENLVNIPIPKVPFLGLGLAILGFLILTLAMLWLWLKGKGLPMNAFPPKKYVKSGIYAIFHHPIYVGAVLMCLGLSLFWESASGFWLISPIFILLIWAYVQGFEKEIIAQNFNHSTHRTLLDFPKNTQEKLSFKNRILIYFWIFLPWLLIYESFIFFGVPPDAISTRIFIDDFVPLWDFSVIFYVMAYPLVLSIPLILSTNSVARKFIFDAIVGMSVIFYCYLVFPFIVPYAPIENHNFLTNLIILSRETDGQTAALPSFHVFWALIFAKYFALRFAKLSLLFSTIAWGIVVSCLATHSHTLLDVVFGLITFYIIDNRKVIYHKLLLFCQRISNSWKEWNFGKIRVINHGFYAAMGGIAGFLIIGNFLSENLFAVYLIGISGFVGAGLWGQFVEGSPALLRPYGYYGSVLGIALTIVGIALFSEIDFWTLMGVVAFSANAIQFFGRFRCLVQGCCHGKPTDKTLGISFIHPKSRVNKIAGWAGKNLYPTQFYSIVTNFLTFFLLLRLIHLEMPSAFISGIYLILNGSFRFVEESLRGEPQTPYFLGMRVYQWLAIFSILAGIGATCVESMPLAWGNWNLNLLVHSLLYGSIVLLAYGIDFPKSNKRFSRLTQ